MDEMISNVLETALNFNRQQKQSGSNEKRNVLIIAPSNSNIDDQINEWTINQQEINGTQWYANASPHRYECELDGKNIRFPIPDYMVESFDLKDTVLLIDHLDLTDDEVREDLLTIVTDKTVPTPWEKEEKRKLNNLLFTIAIAYPEPHFGYRRLSQKEISNFDYILNVG